MRILGLLAFALSLLPLRAYSQGGVVDCTIFSPGINNVAEFQACMADPDNRAAYCQKMQESNKKVPECSDPSAQQTQAIDWQAEFEKYYQEYDRSTYLVWGKQGAHPGWESSNTCQQLTGAGATMQSMGLQRKAYPIVGELQNLDRLYRMNLELLKKIKKERDASCQGTLAYSPVNPKNWKAPLCPWLKRMACGSGGTDQGLIGQWGHFEKAILHAGSCATGMGLGEPTAQMSAQQKFEKYKEIPPSARYADAKPEADCPSGR